MTSIHQFPFGQPVQEVTQTDRSPKQVFVLGVYASAIHARWIGANGKQSAAALAVASEPYIFWRGESHDTEAAIEKIAMPPELGKLEPANEQYNGPSGRALDELILEPMQLSRTNAWLCDLVPHSCINQNQRRAIKRAYTPIAEGSQQLPKASAPELPQPLTDENRRQAIYEELKESRATTLILLGDLPIQWFLNHFDPRWKRLADFLRAGQSYGHPHKAQIKGEDFEVIPLAHPRQVAKLGRSSHSWYDHHQAWRAKNPFKPA